MITGHVDGSNHCLVANQQQQGKWGVGEIYGHGENITNNSYNSYNNSYTTTDTISTTNTTITTISTTSTRDTTIATIIFSLITPTPQRPLHYPHPHLHP